MVVSDHTQHLRCSPPSIMQVESFYPKVVNHCPIFNGESSSSGDNEEEHTKLVSIYDHSSLFDDDFDGARQELIQCLPEEKGTGPFWQQFRSYVIDSVNKHIREAIKPGSKRFPTLFPQITSIQGLHDWSQAVAFEVMCGVVLGKILARLEVRRSDFRNSFDRAVKGIGCGKAATSLTKDLETINNFLEAVVEARQADVLNGPSGGERQDLLWRFVSKKDGKMRREEQVRMRNMIKILILAGTATISTATTWFIWLMAMEGKGEVIKSNEDFHAFQKKIYWRVAGMENWRNQYLLDGLSYLDACLLEAIRMHSLAPNKLAEHNRAVENCCPINDPYKFIPERWVDGKVFFVGTDECLKPRPSFFEAHERGSFTRKMLLVVVKCVAVAVLCRYQVAGGPEANDMKITVIDKEGRKKLKEEENNRKEADKREKEEMKNRRKRGEKDNGDHIGT